MTTENEQEAGERGYAREADMAVTVLDMMGQKIEGNVGNILQTDGVVPDASVLGRAMRVMDDTICDAYDEAIKAHDVLKDIMTPNTASDIMVVSRIVDDMMEKNIWAAYYRYYTTICAV